MNRTPVRMAVTVSRDLTVSVTTDINADKLFDRTQLLKASIQKGEPKALGVRCAPKWAFFSLSLKYNGLVGNASEYNKVRVCACFRSPRSCWE